MAEKERFETLPEYTFARLRNLLKDIPIGPNPVYMSIGEPQHSFPSFIKEAIYSNSEKFNNYPSNDGVEMLRHSICNWISNRYKIPKPDHEKNIMVLNGTREGLFNATIALTPETKNKKTPVILIPNPFYQCYFAASLAARAEPVFVPANEESGFLPNYTSLPSEILNRTTLVFICSPSNPQGAIASKSYWRSLINLAERYDFTVLADECYSEIYRESKPPGILEVVDEENANPERVLIFNSLSKRSNLPGLRSGFVAGGQSSVNKIKLLKSYGGAPVPNPIQIASAMAWNDELHVQKNLLLYQEKYKIADKLLGAYDGYKPPQAGFFIWLKVKNGERFAINLWENSNIQVLPGAYLANKNYLIYPQHNPGEDYVRIALVTNKSDIIASLKKIRATLEFSK